jgi:hypothetical protein
MLDRLLEMKGSVEESWDTGTRKYCFGVSDGVEAMHIRMVTDRSRATIILQS